MSGRLLRIIARKSPLAMWQAKHVSDRLCDLHPGLRVEIIGISTQADRFLDSSLPALGGKGAFVKELEQALREGTADVAVHSMKDVPAQLPPGLVLPVMLPRADARDVFLSNAWSSLESLPAGARIGTSSLRRRSQLLHLRPGAQIVEVRGNVGTRLDKLDRGEFDALILAAAGIERLGFGDRITQFFPTATMLPAVGQGAMGMECRARDETTWGLIRPLDERATHLCVSAERAVNRRLYGGCNVPLAAYARIDRSELILEALVGSLDGAELIRARTAGAPEDAEALGDALGQKLLAQGAAEILREIARDA